MLRVVVRFFLIAVGIVWISAIAGGLYALEGHAATPGSGGSPALRRPIQSRIRPDPSRANLVMLIHPRCPSTRASVGELKRITARCRGLVTAHLLFMRPGRSPEAWERRDLWRTAAAIPGAEVHGAEDGIESGRFGGVASGRILLHGSARTLLCRGGITGSRGRRGDDIGLEAVASRLSGTMTGPLHVPVFGCPLFER